MINFKLLRATAASLLICSAIPTALASDGESYLYSYDFLTRYSNVNVKSPNADNYDPISGLVSFTATDISLPGNSVLKVELRRILEVGNTSVTNSTGEFGTKEIVINGETVIEPSLWSLDIPYVSGHILSGDGINDAFDIYFFGANGCAASYPVNLPGDNPPDKYNRGSVVEPWEYWGGISLYVPGEVSEKFLYIDHQHPNNPVKPSFTTAVSTTKSNWTYNTAECIPQKGKSPNDKSGLLVKAPDGRKFHFTVKKDLLAERSYLPGGSIKLRSNKIRRVLLVSRIEDKFGNYVDYNYDADVNLTSIVGSDGRQIDIQYARQNSDGQNYLTSATANGRVWEYTSNGFGDISEVTLPNGDKWKYASAELFGYTVRPSPIYSHEDIPDGVCRVEPPANEQVYWIEDPDGLKTTYTFKPTRMGRYGIDSKAIVSQTFVFAPSTIATELYLRNKTCSVVYAITEKSMTGPGLPSALNWQYDYSENAGTFNSSGNDPDVIDLYNWYMSQYHAYISYTGEQFVDPIGTFPDVVTALGDNAAAKIKTTLVTGPKGKQLYYIDRQAYSSVSENKILAIDSLDLSNNLLKREEFTFTQGVKVSEKPSEIGHYNQNPAPVNFVTPSNRINQSSKIVTLYDEVATVYTTEYDYDDFYGEVTGTEQYNGFSDNKRYTKQTYQHDFTDWHLNLPAISSVSADGQSYSTTKKTSYTTSNTEGDGTPLMPEYEYVNNEITYARRFQFNSDGTLKQIRFNSALKNSDGSNTPGVFPFRFQEFSNYKRGIPQTVSMPNRYDGTTTVNSSVVVDDNGWVTQYTDLDNIVTNFRYDLLGRIKAVVPMVSGVLDTQFTWGTENLNSETLPVRRIRRCTVATDSACENGTSVLETTSFYDALLRPMQTRTSNLNNLTNVYVNNEYDTYGQLTFQSFPSFSNDEAEGTTNVYDALQRLVSTSQNHGGSQTVEYLSNNRQKTTQQTSATTSNETTTTYLAYGAPAYNQPITISSPESVSTSFEVDIFGNVDSVTQAGASKDGSGTVSLTQYHAYDDLRRLCKVTRADVGITVFKRNALGEITRRAEGLGHGATGSISNCNSDIDAQGSGKHKNFVYDNLGSTWKVNYSDTSPDLEYTYSQQGDLKGLSAGNVNHTYTYEGLHWLNTEQLQVDGKTYLLDYDYDGLGNRSALTYPDGDKVVFAPNPLGQPTQALRKRAGETDFSYANSASYYANGSIDTFSYGNNFTHKTTLNDRKMPSGIKDYAIGGSTALSYDYTYDFSNNIKSIIDSTNDTSSAFSLTNLTYDGLDRLKTTTGGTGIGDSSINYDGLGNITSYTSKDQSLDYNYNTTANRLTSVTGLTDKYASFAYDDRGNIYGNGSKTFTYNRANQLITSSTNSYVYDGHNRRVMQTDSKGTSYSLYSLDGTLLHRETATGGINYIYLGKKLIAKDGVIPKNSGKQHYRPYGESIEGAIDDLGYTGHKFDTDLGLSYMQARYYDPVIGRFYSNDPVGWTPENPVMSFNRYLYVNNNPYKYTDPDGEFLNAIVGALASAALEVAIQVVTTGEVSDWKAVAVAGGTGLVSGGLSTIQKAGKLGKLAAESLDIGIGVAADTIILDKDLSESLVGAGGSKIMGNLTGDLAKHAPVPGKKLLSGANTKKPNSQIKKQNKRTTKAVQENVYQPIGGALGGKAGSEGATAICRESGNC
jgi:RHS repeat-associated protein